MELCFIRARIEGITPLLMHNDRLANPMNEYARRLKEITSKRNKTDADHQMMSRIEFLGGLYYDKEFGVYIPGRNIRKSLVDGATKIRQGTTVKASVTVQEDKVPLVYEGPVTPDELFDAGFADVRMVVPQQTRIPRTRPVFIPPWSLDFTLEFFPDQINANVLHQCLDIAGKLCGIGDYRPAKSGGTFGKYRIAEWSVSQ